MIEKLCSMFRRVTASQVVANQVYEAEIRALQYEAMAERSQALAKMYRDRLARLKSTDKVGTTQSS